MSVLMQGPAETAYVWQPAQRCECSVFERTRTCKVEGVAQPPNHKGSTITNHSLQSMGWNEGE